MRGGIYVLNFYSTVFADQMKRGRKTATIRLGDKRHKYRKNQVVLVTGDPNIESWAARLVPAGQVSLVRLGRATAPALRR